MSSSTPLDPTWERYTIEKILMETIKEQRRQRRWRIFFRIIYLLLLISVIFMLKPEHAMDYTKRNKTHSSLVSIEGPIMSDNHNNADDIMESLKAAFEDPKTKGVIIRLNSPGGSPVQADEIYGAIRALEKQHPKLPVIAVCSDICASAAYYIAAATQSIYANPASIVGSIGVRMDSFGFVDTLQKLGITRRLVTAGTNKDFMDPFLPLNPSDVEHAHKMLDTVHQQFIAAVEQGRGKRLKHSPELFSGLAWTGTDAKDNGLIDNFGNVNFVAKNVIKAEDIVDYSSQSNLLTLLANNMGSQFAHTFLAAIRWQSPSSLT
ncbi:MAG: S49 family peptidase [Gammaproteobacteria bacterium]